MMMKMDLIITNGAMECTIFRQAGPHFMTCFPSSGGTLRTRHVPKKPIAIGITINGPQLKSKQLPNSRASNQKDVLTFLKVCHGDTVIYIVI